MNEKYVIEFTRNQSEANKIYFKKLFKKQIWTHVIRLIGIIPVAILLSIVFADATKMAFELERKGHDWLIVILTLLIIFPFASPIFKLYRHYNKQVKEA